MTRPAGTVRRRVPMAGRIGMLLVASVVIAGCTTSAAGSSLTSLASSAGAAASGAVTASPTPASSAAPAPAAATATATATAASPTPSAAPKPPPPPPPKVTVDPADGASGINPLAPVKVAVSGGTLGEVTMTNAAGKQIPGKLGADKKSWTVTPELGYGKTYTVTAAARNAAGATTTTTTTFTTVEPENRTAARTFPSDGMTVGVAQPIAIYFDEPITDRAAAQKAITISTKPAQVGGFRWISDTELRWRPKAFWKAGTKVTVDVGIYGRDLGGGLYGHEDVATAFTIGRWMSAEVDSNTKMMTVRKDGKVIRTIPVSLGRDKYPTYNGVHVVAEKYAKKIMDSSTWGLTGAGAYRTEVEWATRISSSGEFVHAAPWSVDQQGVENVSHGCVNVSTEAAKWFHDTFIPGDPVVISNTVGPQLEVWDGFGDFQLPFDQYVAGQD
jgi:lipoprotein-anchoring transpeptidase ErfK/SrfK